MSSLVLSGDTSGTVTMSVPSISGTNTVSVQAGTGTMSLNTLMTAWTYSTPVSSVDFTGIPSWVKRITVMFAGVSTSGTSAPLIQLGISTGVISTGYISTANRTDQANGTNGLSSTAGFVISSIIAANTISGQIIITNLSSNIWVCSHTLKTSTALVEFGGGDITLSATLDRVRITTVNGTDTFDAGSINVLYEG